MTEKIKMAEIRAKFPMYSDLSDEQLLSGLRQKYYADIPEDQFRSRIEVESPARREPFAAKLGRAVRDTAAGAVRGAGSIGATIMAPVDAAARQLGIENEYIGRRDRREAMDSALQGLGADTDSLAYKGGKIGAEVAGTAGVGNVLAAPLRVLAAAKGVAPAVAAGANRFGNALASGGFRTGAPMTGSIGARAADMGVRMAGGASTGAAAAGLIDPDDVALGAGVGAALPPVAKLAGAAGRAVGSLTKSGGRRAAVNKLASEIGEGAIPQTVGDIQTYYPKGAESIPVSAAGVTQSPALARLEQGSRLRNSPAWYEFDQKQAKAVADNVMTATAEADELGKRFAQRAENWADNWAKASDNIKPRVFAKRKGQLLGDLQQAKASPEAVNSEVAAVLQEVEDTVMKFGKGFTPAHLQQLRAEFNDKVKPMAKTAMKSAPRDNPAIKSLIAELDDILNATTSGKWDKVRAGYAEDTTKVHAAKAAQVVRNAFVDPTTGIVRKSADAAGDVPKITDAGLMRAIEAARLPDKTIALSPDAAQRLEATLDAIRRQNIVQGVKRSAAAGGGSDTVGNAIAAGGSVVEHGVLPIWAQAVLHGSRRLATGRVDDAMANLLMSPDDLALALQAYANRQPNALAAVPYRVAPVLAAERQ